MKVHGPVNKAVLSLLAGRSLGAQRSFVGLAVRGRRSGEVFRFPVQYAGDGVGLVVSPGHAASKTWWRNLRGGPTELDVLLDGRWQHARGEVVQAGDLRYDGLRASYTRRWPGAGAYDGEPVVRLLLDRSRSTQSEQEPTPH